MPSTSTELANAIRRKRAIAAIDHYRGTSGEPLKDSLADLICDAMHVFGPELVHRLVAKAGRDYDAERVGGARG